MAYIKNKMKLIVEASNFDHWANISITPNWVVRNINLLQIKSK